jgi:hypothetical protein
VVFLQNSEVPVIFWIYFPKDNSVEYVHVIVDWSTGVGSRVHGFIKRWPLARIKPNEPLSRLLISYVHH